MKKEREKERVREKMREGWCLVVMVVMAVEVTRLKWEKGFPAVDTDFFLQAFNLFYFFLFNLLSTLHTPERRSVCLMTHVSEFGKVAVRR